MPRIGGSSAPVIALPERGLSWLAVETISSLPPLTTGRAHHCQSNHPGFGKLLFEAGEGAKGRIDGRSQVTGPLHPPPFSPISPQNIEWLDDRRHCCVLPGDFSGTLPDFDQILDAFALPVNVAFQGRIQIINVSLMMLAVMDFHRPSINMRFQRIWEDTVSNVIFTVHDYDYVLL